MSEYAVKLDNFELTAELNGDSVNVAGTVYENCSLTKINEQSYVLSVGNKKMEVAITEYDKDEMIVTINGRDSEITIRSKLKEKAYKLMSNKSNSSGAGKIKAPMPGLILKIHKSIGEEVEPGEALIILEAMKMENEIRADKSGNIEEIYVSEGDSVDKNQVLITIV